MKLALSIVFIVLVTIFIGVWFLSSFWHRPVTTDVQLGLVQSNALRGSFSCPGGRLAGFGLNRSSTATGTVSLAFTNANGTLWFATNVQVSSMQRGNWFGGNSLVSIMSFEPESSRSRGGTNISFDIRFAPGSDGSVAWLRFVDYSPRIFNLSAPIRIIKSSKITDNAY
jgi:hypothetical protein